MATIYDTFDKSLYRKQDGSVVEINNPIKLPVDATNPLEQKSGTLVNIITQEDGNIHAGKSDFESVRPGYIFGLNRGVPYFIIGDSTQSFSWNGTTLTLSGVTIPLITTLTRPSTQSVANAATITPNGDTDECVDITAIAQAFTIAAPTGSPTNMQRLVIRIKDNGTSRAITWNAIYVQGGVALPATTTVGKTMYLGFIYNTANSLNKWQLVASTTEL